MDEIIEEYGGVILGIFAGIAVVGVVARLLGAGGMLREMILLLGNMAC